MDRIWNSISFPDNQSSELQKFVVAPLVIYLTPQVNDIGDWLSVMQAVKLGILLQSNARFIFLTRQHIGRIDGDILDKIC